MIPKSDNREKLLAETYHGDWSTGPAAAFARTAARSARRRTTLRRALQTSAIAALLLAATLAIPANRTPVRIAGASTALVSPPVSAPPTYEIISDTELLALVQDRPLLLVQNDDTPGSSRQIITFDY
jgi:hypothetical protein